MNNGNNSVLFRRFIILSSDSDSDIKMVISYQIKFICEEADNENINKNLIKPILDLIEERNMNPIIKIESIISLTHIIDRIEKNSVIESLEKSINELFTELDLLNNNHANSGTSNNIDFIFRLIDEIFIKSEQLQYGLPIRQFIEPMVIFVKKLITMKKRNLINKCANIVCFVLDKYNMLYVFLKNFMESEVISNLNEAFGRLYQHLQRKDRYINKFNSDYYMINVSFLKNITNVY